MNDNKRKAHVLVDAKAVVHVDGALWHVKSLSTIGAKHNVQWYGSGGSCTCRKYKFSQPAWCHHLEAVEMVASAKAFPMEGGYLDEQIP